MTVHIDESSPPDDAIARNADQSLVDLEIGVASGWHDLTADRTPRTEHHDLAPVGVAKVVGEAFG